MFNVTSVMLLAKTTAIKYAPHAMVFGGAGLMGAAVVMAAKAAKKDGEFQEALSEGVEESITTGLTKETATIVGLEFLKVYGPTILVTISGVALIGSGFGIMTNRLAGTAAAAAALASQLDTIKKRLETAGGKELVSAAMGANVGSTKIPQDGRKNIVFELELDDQPLTYYFDQSNSDWTPDQNMNRVRMDSVLEHLRRVYAARGVVLLNELLKSLGIPQTKEGAILGWSIDHTHSKGDVYIDFVYKDDIVIIVPHLDGVVANYLS